MFTSIKKLEQKREINTTMQIQEIINLARRVDKQMKGRKQSNTTKNDRN
jgi:hypothetical protein